MTHSSQILPQPKKSVRLPLMGGTTFTQRITLHIETTSFNLQGKITMSDECQQDVMPAISVTSYLSQSRGHFQVARVPAKLVPAKLLPAKAGSGSRNPLKTGTHGSLS